MSIDFSDSELQNLKNWADNYEKALSTFEKDLRLKVENRSNIFVAIDFFDLYNYCFTDLRLFNENASNRDRYDYLKRTIALYGLFYIFWNIYSLPINILPPHLNELIDFFKVYRLSLKRIQESELEFKYIAKHVKDTLSEKKNNDLYSNIELINKLEKCAPDLAFLFRPSFTMGLEGLRELMRKSISPIIEELGAERYHKIASEIDQQSNDIYEPIFNNLRPYKIIQNKRDAKSMQYLIGINNAIRENDLLIFVSSAHIFKIFQKNSNIRIKKEIKSEEYILVRDTEPFYAGLIELCDLLSLEGKDLSQPNICDINLREFLSLVQADLKLLRTLIYAAEDAICKKELNQDNYIDIIYEIRKFKDKVECKERIDLILLIGSFGTNLYNLEKMKPLSEDIYKMLRNVSAAINTNEFKNIISRKIFEHESDKIQLENWMKKSFNDLVTDDYNRAGLYENKITTLEENSLKNTNLIKNPFTERGLSYPSNPEIVQLSDNAYLLIDKNNINGNLYIIRRKLGSLELFEINTNLIYLILFNIHSKLQNGQADIKIPAVNNILKYVKDNLMPLNCIPRAKYKNKIGIEDTYKKITKFINSSIFDQS